MQEESFRSMIMALEANGVTRDKIAESIDRSIITVWRLKAISDWRPTSTTAKRLAALYDRSISPMRRAL